MKDKRQSIPRLEYEALVQSCFEQLKDLLKTNMAELEARIYATTYPSLSNDKIDFSPFAQMAVDQTVDEMRNNLESLYNAPEKPMRNFTVTRPVLVGNVNILTASDDALVNIIRDAKEEQENIKDMVEVSAKFKAKSKELDDAIALWVEQLDKEDAQAKLHNDEAHAAHKAIQNIEEMFGVKSKQSFMDSF